MSLPTRGGWIEMQGQRPQHPRHSGPSPHGEGGLKLQDGKDMSIGCLSLPTRGGWIEIAPGNSWALCQGRSLPTRGGWIEILDLMKLVSLNPMSLPTRGGWIETEMLSTRNTYKIVILNEYTCSVYINSQVISSRNAMIPSTELKLRRGSYYL